MRKRKSRKKRSKKFGEREFVKTVWETMTDQAKAKPGLHLLHERLSPEFEQVTGLIRRLLTTAKESEDGIISEILKFEGKALLPLIDFIRNLRKSI